MLSRTKGTSGSSSYRPGNSIHYSRLFPRQSGIPLSYKQLSLKWRTPLLEHGLSSWTVLFSHFWYQSSNYWSRVRKGCRRGGDQLLVARKQSGIWEQANNCWKNNGDTYGSSAGDKPLDPTLLSLHTHVSEFCGENIPHKGMGTFKKLLSVWHI